MENIFLSIVNMSIAASYVILFILIVRLFLKNAPKIFSYALWIVVYSKLISTFSFTSTLGIFKFLSIKNEYIPKNIGYVNAPQINTGLGIDTIVNNSLPQATVTASINPMQFIISILGIIWLIGFGILVIYNIICYISLKRKVKYAILISDNIFESECIKSPFVMGIIKPKVYIPTPLKESDYIIKHEQIHIKRFDYIIKPLTFFITCIHWFNPLVWLSFFLINKDMEMSCDERVLKEMGNGIKKDYSNSLLNTATNKNIISGYPPAFGESNTKNRIKNVLNYKNPSFWGIIIAISITIISFIFIMVNPKQQTIDEIYKGYNIDKLSQHKRQYVGEISNLSAIIGLLPTPDKSLIQQFISVNEEQSPAVTIYYETELVNKQQLLAKFENANSDYNKICNKNAFILFSLLDNLNEVVYGTRFIRSDNILDEEQYENLFVINRSNFDFSDDLWSDKTKLKQMLDTMDLNTTELKFMTLEDVYTIARKQDNVTMEDFKSFYGEDTGSGRYIYSYNIEKTKNNIVNYYTLVVVSNSDTGKPLDVRFSKHNFNKFDDEQSIDIRTNDIDIYLRQNTAKIVIDNRLNNIMSSPAVSSNPADYITAHKEDFDIIVALDYNALPVLTDILNSNEKSLKDHIALALIEDILNNRMFSSFWTPEIGNQETDAKKAVADYNTILN